MPGGQGGLHTFRSARPVGTGDVDSAGETEPIDVAASACHGTLPDIGGVHAGHTRAREDGGQHAGTGSDIEGCWTGGSSVWVSRSR